MTPSAGILTFLLTSFLSVFSGGFGALLPHAKHLLFLMAGIELTLAALFWALKGENLIVPLIQKSLVIGTFAYFVLNWPNLINMVLSGFIFTGQTAGSGGGGGAILSLTDPSGIISQGLNAISPISTTISTIPWYDVGDIFLLGWALIFTILAFAIIGIQCFITYLEFYIVAVLALILVPFGVFRHTAFLAEKSLGIVISHGVKLMVLAFIISAATPVLAALTTVLPGTGVTFDQALSVMVGSMAIAFLAWHAPALAGGMMSGGPSLNAGTAVGTAVSAGIGAALGLSGARAAASSIASGGASATMSAARGLGAASTAGRLGAATAAMGGAGTVGQTVGAVRGVASAATGAARSAVTSPAGAVVQSLTQAFKQGGLSGYKATGGKTAAQVNSTPPTPPTPPSAGGGFMSAARMAHSAVPPVASAGPGISVPLNTP